MIETVLRVTLAAFALGGAGLFAASRKVDAATRRVRFVKFLTYFVVIHVFLFAASAGFEALAALMFAIAAFGAYELYRGLASTSSFFRGTVAFVYTILATSMIVFAIGSTPARAVFVYLVVAAFDGFSQVAGQLFGRRKLVPRLSPAKTVEGTAGGAVLAAIIAVLLRGLAGLSVAGSLATCLWLIVAALTGDLAASWLKRTAGIKDFGGALPGHGGILDRFDSLLVAAPVSLFLPR